MMKEHKLDPMEKGSNIIIMAFGFDSSKARHPGVTAKVSKGKQPACVSLASASVSIAGTVSPPAGYFRLVSVL